MKKLFLCLVLFCNCSFAGEWTSLFAVTYSEAEHVKTRKVISNSASTNSSPVTNNNKRYSSGRTNFRRFR